MVVEPDPTDHDRLRFGPVDREDGKLRTDAPTARWMDEPVDGVLARWAPEVRDGRVDGWWVTSSLMVGRRRDQQVSHLMLTDRAATLRAD